MRNLCLFLAVVASGTAVVGCEGKAGSPAAAQTQSADAQTAAKIRKSALKYGKATRELDVEQAIADSNEATAAQPQQSELPAASTTSRPATPNPAPKTTNGSLLSAADKTSFNKLARKLGGTSGVALKAAGVPGKVAVAGTLRTGVAWSTIKTGIAAATFASGTPDARTKNLLRRAITASDNAAAEQLWSNLGAPTTAGSKVTAQLRAAGDDNTTVQTQRVRSGFTAFGQSQWSLASQVRFTSGLPCLSAGKKVLDLMGQVVSDQRWGLGSAGVPAAFKGGWGPGSSGGYLVRQMGILTIHGRPVAVTIATLPGDDSFGTGTANLTKIAAWVVSHANYKNAPKAIRC